MALSLRAASGADRGATTATSQAITLPTGTAANDAVYFVISVGAVISAPTLTAGAGWTLVLTTDGTGGLSTIVGYKTVGASETAPTVSWTGAGLTAWSAIGIAPGAGNTATHSAFGTVSNNATAALSHTPGTYTAPVTALTSVILTGLRTSATSASVGVTNTPSTNWLEASDQSTATGTVRQQGAHIEYRLGLNTGGVNPSAIAHSLSSYAVIQHAFVVEAAGVAYAQTVTDAAGAADSVTPVTGTTTPQAFTRTITDAAGATDNTSAVGPPGGVTAAGRMFVTCAHTGGTPIFSAVRSTTGYAWSGSSLLFEAVQMPGVAGVDTAFAQMWIMDPSPTDTVDRLGFEYRAAANALDLVGQTGAGYAPIGTTTTLTYSAATHRWLRITHTGSSIVWDTSPDGLTWTTQRTLATPPAWTTKTTLRVSFEAYRTTGTNDLFLLDSVNLPPLRIVRPVRNLSAVGRSYSF